MPTAVHISSVGMRHDASAAGNKFAQRQHIGRDDAGKAEPEGAPPP